MIDFRKITYFLGAGSIGFVIDAITFFGMSVGADFSYTWSRITASTTAMISTWLINRSLAFSGSRTASSYRELVRYLLASAAGALCNLFVLLAVARYDETLFHVPAYIAGATFGLIVNYLLYQNFVFTGQLNGMVSKSASNRTNK